MAVITELNLYPIKSCAGISLREAVITPAGLMSQQIYDREWMVVDADGEFMTQREHPRMALITPRLKLETLELRAPGMLRLEIPLDLPHPDDARVVRVKVWNDTVDAYDCDEVTATWFSNFLGVPCRLVRFHAEAKRIANTRWTGGVEAPTFFSDGYPVLVISQASLDDLNGKLAAQGRNALPMNRFRPNLVIAGVEAFEEDYASALTAGEAELKPVKPCPRCPMPSVDQATGAFGPDPMDILQTYRANPKVDGGITFGMNAILAKGEGEVLRVGQDMEVTLAF
ncbi:MOSC domain-containing protein [Noviherbaspirillum galbum]|uniref:MOSC domain-containing protein n=1 Tax=Noviherbaspirillum galbum TaxID=2709383 RepID=A0A6B3STL5_9BURK|nr:MOSC N-terminal beta barrel domain-containing protein [Noviherbaspirillum galbum]NEX64330.1 MOSC domain-containing protein [Noviherbaspirillum galbum]